MSFDELVQRYRQRIDATPNKKQELGKILREIDRLTYLETRRPISKEDKRRILEELRKKTIQESAAHFAQDNSEFIELIDITIDALGGE